jgi:hypothetical protein
MEFVVRRRFRTPGNRVVRRAPRRSLEFVLPSKGPGTSSKDDTPKLEPLDTGFGLDETKRVEILR